MVNLCFSEKLLAIAMLLHILFDEIDAFKYSFNISKSAVKGKPKKSKTDRLAEAQQKFNQSMNIEYLMNKIPPLPSLPELPPRRHILHKPKGADYNPCKVVALCQNGGVCVPRENEFYCDCKPGFYGKTCGFMSNDTECQKLKKYEQSSYTPCQNDGICYSVDTPSTILADEFNTARVYYRCWCKSGFHGFHCEFTESMRKCAEDQCNYHGYIDTDAQVNEGNCVCKCEEGYWGDRCEIISPCADINVCQNSLLETKCECKGNEKTDCKCDCLKLTREYSGYYGGKLKLDWNDFFETQGEGIDCSYNVTENLVKWVDTRVNLKINWELDYNSTKKELFECLPCMSTITNYIDCLKKFSDAFFNATCDGYFLNVYHLNNTWDEKVNVLSPWLKTCVGFDCDQPFNDYCLLNRNERIQTANGEIVDVPLYRVDGAEARTGLCTAKISTLLLSSDYYWDDMQGACIASSSLLDRLKDRSYMRQGWLELKNQLYVVPHCDCHKNRDGDFCEIPYSQNLCDKKVGEYEMRSTRCDFGSCVNDPYFPDKYICACYKGYRGARCQSKDPCYGNPCGKALCIELRPAEIEAFNVTHACICKFDKHSEEGLSCLDATHNTEKNREIYRNVCIDQRTNSSKCRNGGHCIPCQLYPVLCGAEDTDDHFRCQCPPNYLPPYCEKNPDACTDNKCQNGADCVIVKEEYGEYNCTCPFGYEGKLCERALKICDTKGFDACLHGECNPDETYGRGFSCKCAPGFRGINCDLVVTYDFWQEFHKNYEWSYPLSLNILLIPIFVILKLFQECTHTRKEVVKYKKLVEIAKEKLHPNDIKEDEKS